MSSRSDANAATPWTGEMPFLEPALNEAKTRGERAPSPRPRIVHLIGTLGPGGAERQLCNFVIAAKRLGYDVLVMLMWPPVGDHGHYLHLLEAEGVEVRIAGATFDPRFPKAARQMAGGLDVLRQIPADCWPVVADIAGELLVDRPDVLHAWLDGSNIWGGMAAVLSQVPLIVLSTRNVNPMNFPELSRPYYRRAYTKLLEYPGVRLVNNSKAGADDYARWLGIDSQRIAVVVNGLDVSRLRRPSQSEAAAVTAAANVPDGARVIAGVFRLAEEKQPFVFLEVVRGVMQQCPDVVAMIAGVGPREAEMRAFVSAHHLDSSVRFLGRLDDTAPVYAAADVLLLCSRKEGTPNVLLEAQWLGCPVVSTRAGGAVDAVADGVTGYLVDVGDVSGLQRSVLTLLGDEALRRRMAANGPPFIESRFSIERMVTDTLKLYGITYEHQFTS
jgi:glycosyltransferase involved in cell wall biosynthesis